MGGALPADRFFDPARLEARYRLADAAVDRELLAATRVGASACVGVGVGKREGVRESVGGWVPVGLDAAVDRELLAATRLGASGAVFGPVTLHLGLGLLRQ